MQFKVKMLQTILKSRLKQKQETKVYWAEYSYRAGKLLIETAFWFGALPLSFKLHDSNYKKIQHVKSKFHQIRCKLCISLIFVLFFLITAGFLHDILNGDITFREKIQTIYVLRGAVTILSFCFALFHLHTFWKIKSIVTFINGCSRYYEQFQGECLFFKFISC